MMVRDDHMGKMDSTSCVEITTEEIVEYCLVDRIILTHFKAILDLLCIISVK